MLSDEQRAILKNFILLRESGAFSETPIMGTEWETNEVNSERSERYEVYRYHDHVIKMRELKDASIPDFMLTTFRLCKYNAAGDLVDVSPYYETADDVG